MSCIITASEFKQLFDRGQFDYGDFVPSIRDKDIEEAIFEAEAVFNCDLYGSDEDICKKALLYLTAHYLTLDIEATDSGGMPMFNQTSRSADGISESVHIPDWMAQGDFAFYSTTMYGQKYLVLSKPYLDGTIYSVSGGTQF